MKLFNEISIVIATGWAEARGEPLEGLLAVFEVIRKRTRDHYNSDGTLIGTCCKDRQFSCWNNNDPQRLQMLKLDSNDPLVIRCTTAWVQSEWTNHSNGAVLYHAKSMRTYPYWVGKCRVVARIGEHIFYVENN